MQRERERTRGREEGRRREGKGGGERRREGKGGTCRGGREGKGGREGERDQEREGGEGEREREREAILSKHIKYHHIRPYQNHNLLFMHVSSSDIDECLGEHGCDQECVNDAGGFHCVCRAGFQLMDTFTCIGKLLTRHAEV